MDDKTYQVSGVIIDKYDTPHYFDVQVAAASVDNAQRKLRSVLRLRKHDLLRDIRIREIS